MSQNSLLLIICLLGYVGTAVLEHLNLLPAGASNFIYGALTSALGVTGAVAVTKGAPVTLRPTPTTTPTTPIVPGGNQAVNDPGIQG